MKRQNIWEDLRFKTKLSKTEIKQIFILDKYPVLFLSFLLAGRAVITCPSCYFYFLDFSVSYWAIVSLFRVKKQETFGKFRWISILVRLINKNEIYENLKATINKLLDAAYNINQGKAIMQKLIYDNLLSNEVDTTIFP